MGKLSSYAADTTFEDTDYVIGVDAATGKTKRFPASIIKAGLATEADITEAKSRANHTGTQTADTISDFEAAVLGITGSGGVVSAIRTEVSLTAHGFAVGDVLYKTASTYAKAKAVLSKPGDAQSEVIGIVSVVSDANTFSFTSAGLITGLSGLTAGTTYYLSATTAGALTATRPYGYATFATPVLVAVSSTSGVIQIQQGVANVTGRPFGLMGINFGFSTLSDSARIIRDLQYIGRYTSRLRITIPSWNDSTGITNVRNLVTIASNMGFEVTYGVTAAGTGHDLTYYNNWKSQVITEAAWAAANNVDIFYIGNEEDHWISVGGITGVTTATLRADVLNMAQTIKGSYPDMKLAYSTAESQMADWSTEASTNTDWEFLDYFGLNMYNADFSGTLEYAQSLAYASKLFLSEWNDEDNQPTSGKSDSAFRAEILERRRIIVNAGVPAYYFTWDWGGSYGTSDDWGLINSDGTVGAGFEEIFGVPR